MQIQAATLGDMSLQNKNAVNITGGTITGTTISSYVSTSITVNGHALNADVTVTKSDLALGNVENTALSTWVGSGNITTLGIIGSGTWQGNAIASAYIGTLNQNTTGSAATLATPRAINGVAFDGSAPITITAASGTLTGTTLASNVVASSLTSVGTISSGTWSGSFGAISGANLTTLNASNISSGTLLDARLSGNIPLLNAANTFTGNEIISTAGAVSTPAFTMTGAPYAAGSTTTNKPLFLIEGTGATSNNWNANGTFAGINSTTGWTGDVFSVQQNGTVLFTVEGSSSNIVFGDAQPLKWRTRSKIWGGVVDGNIRLSNNAGTSFSTLQFGGTSTSFPGLTRSGTTLQASFGDGTAGGGFQCTGTLQVDGALSGTGVTNYFASPPAIGGTVAAAGNFTAGTFTTSWKSTTALATPSTLSATQFTDFASTVSGAAIMGYGTTNDVSLMNRAGTVCLGIGPNTTTVNIPGIFAVTGTTTLTGTTIHGAATRLKVYTVATLPASPTQGDCAAVTDALTPAFLTVVVGGGSTYTPVTYNGTAWIGF